MVNQLRLLV